MMLSLELLSLTESSRSKTVSSSISLKTNIEIITKDRLSAVFDTFRSSRLY
jgi:hypothetical protein